VLGGLVAERHAERIGVEEAASDFRVRGLPSAEAREAIDPNQVLVRERWSDPVPRPRALEEVRRDGDAVVLDVVREVARPDPLTVGEDR
jgi:hypothetical protein